MTTDTYITSEEAAAMLGRSMRTVQRYGRDGRLTTHEIAGRMFYLRAEVEQLANELGITQHARRPKVDLMPIGDMLDYLREKDAELAALHEKLERAAVELGKLQTENEAKTRLLTDADMARHKLTEATHEAELARQRLAEVEHERDNLQAQLIAAQEQIRLLTTEKPSEEQTPAPTEKRPWWKRFFS